VTFTFSHSPTVTLTPVPLPFSLSVRVYNAAGEAVRVLYQGGAEALPSGWAPDRAAILAGSPALFRFPGQLSHGGAELAWDGANDAGQWVSAGAYNVVLESRDPFGSVTAHSASVTVLRSPEGARITVFNSAGERVFSRELPAMAASASGFDLESPSLGAGEKLWARFNIASGPALLEVWDGRNHRGEPVASGSYTVTLELPSGSGRISQSRALSVLKGPEQRALGLGLGPNPWRSGQGAWLSYAPAPGRTATLRLYNLAGELLGSGADPQGLGRVPLPNAAWAPGILLVQARVQEPGQAPYTRILKLAAIR
jgi:hypothetical protein